MSDWEKNRDVEKQSYDVIEDVDALDKPSSKEDVESLNDSREKIQDSGTNVRRFPRFLHVSLN